MLNLWICTKFYSEDDQITPSAEKKRLLSDFENQGIYLENLIYTMKYGLFTNAYYFANHT